jgi:hypothetical protein
VLFLLSVGCVAFLAGCGGSGSKATSPDAQGAIQFTVDWPEPSRLIPLAAQSIRIEVTVNRQPVAQPVIIRRPNTIATINNLNTGPVTITVTAHPNPDGTGTVQATGSVVVTIVADQTVQQVLTMASTISQVAITPDNPSLVQALVQGTRVQLVASALNAGGAVVLTDRRNWTWSSSDPAIASVTASGDTAVVNGAAVGRTTINVTESESTGSEPGRSASVTVTVVEPVSVSINPPAATVALGARQPFTAAVRGSANTAVTWSVREGAAGGTIDSSGLYTAPATAGIYTVVATSQADPTKSAVATVTVPIEVSITPTMATVYSERFQFTATVRGTTNATVFWSIRADSTGRGTIDSNGVYTGPGGTGGGQDFVVVTSQADPTKSATAVVTVPVG